MQKSDISVKTAIMFHVPDCSWEARESRLLGFLKAFTMDLDANRFMSQDTHMPMDPNSQRYQSVHSAAFTQ